MTVIDVNAIVWPGTALPTEKLYHRAFSLLNIPFLYIKVKLFN